MPATAPRRRAGPGAPLAAGALGVLLVVVLGVAVIVTAIAPPSNSPCGDASAGTGISLGPPGAGARVGATEYGGPGDPSSGHVGSSGADLLAHPDSYAELGGLTFDTATALGGLPYLTALRVTWGGHSTIAYKRDIGFGGAPVDGLPRVIDLWWQLAGALRIPYERGLWSGSVRVQRPPATGAGAVLGVSAGATANVATTSGCGATGAVPITAGPRARLLADGTAAAPAGAPPAVRGIIAAGNAIVGKPYTYGGGHGLPLDDVASTYDCSSSVEHLLYGGRLLPVGYDAPSGTLESFGRPGPGRWVTIYASADHVFMYVAGLRWDTHNAAGAGDGSSGIGWHPLVREADGFVARHPVGL